MPSRVFFFFSFRDSFRFFLFNRAKAGRMGKMNRMPRGNVFLIFYSCCLREPRLFSSRFDLNLEVGVRIAYSSNVESVYRRARELEGSEGKEMRGNLHVSRLEWWMSCFIYSTLRYRSDYSRKEMREIRGKTRVTEPLVYNSTRISAHLPLFSVVATFGIKYSSPLCDLNNVETFARQPRN